MNLDEIIELITLEELEDCLYRGQSYKTPWRRVFGGQVLGQALNAAYRTVAEDRFAHSFHGYFILPGDVNKPIVYQVQKLRDGGSFSTRRVTAIQHGKAIFVMAASFQKRQEGFDHQNEMPSVEAPDHLLTDLQQAEKSKDQYPGTYLKALARQQAGLEFRPVEDINEITEAGKTIRNVWMKTTEHKELDLPMQHQLLAYTSDYDLLLSAVIPHRTKENTLKLFLASLDHAMWFHRDFDFNDWLLYNIDSPSASNSRGLGYGRIFDQKGRLVSTVMQEGLIRLMRQG